MKNYHPVLLTVTKKMLVQLYGDPDGFMEHFRLYVFKFHMLTGDA